MYKVFSILIVLFIVLALEYGLIDFTMNLETGENEFDRIVYWRECFLALGIGVLLTAKSVHSLTRK